LRESEVRFRELADNISQFAWTADEKGWSYWYNKDRQSDAEGTLEEMQGWGWQKVHHPDHVNRVVHRIKQSFDTGTPWEDTFPLRGPGAIAGFFRAPYRSARIPATWSAGSAPTPILRSRSRRKGRCAKARCAFAN